MTATQQAPGWGRRRLLAALTGAVLLAAALLAGLAYVLVDAVTDPAPENSVLVSSTASPVTGPVSRPRPVKDRPGSPPGTRAPRLGRSGSSPRSTPPC